MNLVGPRLPDGLLVVAGNLREVLLGNRDVFNAPRKPRPVEIQHYHRSEQTKTSNPPI